MVYGFCHYSDGSPAIGWEANHMHINRLTREQTKRRELREHADKLWREASELADMVGFGGVTWDDVTMIQNAAKELENKALGH